MQWINIDEVCRPKQWKTISMKNLKEEGYPVYGANGIIGYHDEYTHEEDAIMITCRGATCGSINMSKGKAYINGNAMALDNLNNEIIDAKYFYYYLLGYDFTEIISGSAQPQITRTNLKRLKIPVPPINIQKQIVEVLDEAQSLIDNRKEQIKLLDDLIESVFYDMFGDPVLNPMGWLTCNVEEVCEKIMGGGTPSKSKPEYYVGKIPWVTPKDMKTINIVDSQDHINDLAIQNSSAKLIPAGSLLMVIRSGILKRYLPIALNSVDVTINQDMKAFLMDSKKIDKYFFLYFWMLAQRFILSKVRSVTADNIEFKQIKEMKIIIPPLNLQNKFSEKVEQIACQKQLLEDSQQLLEDNYNSLIQRAFKGELFN